MVSERFFISPRRVLSWLLWILVPVAALAAPVPSKLSAIAPEYEAMNAPATLRIGNRYVVRFRASIGLATPAERVLAAEERVAQLSDEELSNPISVKEARLKGQQGLGIYVGSTQLFALLEDDVDPLSDHALQEEAALAAKNLFIGLKTIQEQHQPEIVLQGAVLSLAAIALFTLATWFIMRVRMRMTHALEASVRRGLARMILRDVGMTAPMTGFLRGITAFASWLAIFCMAYACGTFILKSFPYTAPWGEALSGNILRLFQGLGSRAIQAIPGIVTVIVIFVIARMATQMLNAFLRAVEDERISAPFLYPDTARATRWLLLAAIWLFALAIAYPYIPGSDSAAFQGISVIAGLMLSLGSAGIVNQAMSGLVLVYSRALAQGDLVKIDAEKGIVTSVGLLSTKIETYRNEEVTIPNAVVVGAQITNFSRLAKDKGAAIVTTVSIGYDTSWRQVVAMLTLAARNTGGIQKDVAPYVLQRELTDFHIKYDLIACVERPDTYELVLNELHGNIQDVFNEHEVQIMSPNFQAQPDKKVIVPKDRWFASPSMR